MVGGRKEESGQVLRMFQGIVGFGKACEIANNNLEENYARLVKTRDEIIEKYWMQFLNLILMVIGMKDCLMSLLISDSHLLKVNH